MKSNELPDEIRRLVDHLRAQKNQEFSLTDIASVTEVLVSTMVAYFSSVDASIYKECRSLSEYIAGAKEEIAALAPSDDDSGIPRAGKELDAIVQATEEATDTIMSSAEAVMNALGEEDLEAQRGNIENAIMAIFEACSFQDITGQRISKVVETFSHIESRVGELKDLMGVTNDDVLAAKDKGSNKKPKHDELARGPSLAGEGIAQDQVDSLMSEGFDSAPAPEPSPAPRAKEEAPKESKKAVAPKPKEIASEPNGGEEMDRDAIDALFD